MAPRNRPEQHFQASLVKTLETILTPETAFFAVPNGGARSRIEAAILKGQGVKAGVPDLVLVHGRQSFGLELKACGGRLSGAQVGRHEELTRAGMRIAVVKTIDDALRWLKVWDIPTRIKAFDRAAA